MLAIINAVDQLLPMFLLIFIGVVLGKTGFASSRFRSDLTEFCFMVLFPACIVNSFHLTLDSGKLVSSAKLIVIGFVWVVAPLVVAMLVTKRLRVEIATANVLVFSSAFCNLGFAGMGIVSSLYGVEGVFYANMMALTYNLINLPVGAWIMERGTRKQSENMVRSALKSPPVLAILGMVVVVLFQLQLPAVVYDTAKMLTNCLAPLGMMVTGMSVSEFSLGELIRGRACYVICALRLLVLPAVMGAVMWRLGIDGVAFAAALLMMGMPVAANCSLLAQKYGGNTKLAAQCVLLSTLLSLLTIPVLVMLGGKTW